MRIHPWSSGRALLLGASVALSPLASLGAASAQQCGELAPIAGTPWSLPVVGDVNASGTLNVADMLCMVLAVLSNTCGGGPAPACLQVPASNLDFNCDGACTTGDITLAQLHLFSAPLDPLVDGSESGVPDLCEEIVPCPWSAPLVLDGSDADWPSEATFATSGGGSTATVITWDDDDVYVGVRHPDVQSGGDQHWIVVTIGNGGPGASIGTQLGNQEPALSFPAQYVVRWRANDTYDSRQSWDGSAWVDQPNWLGTAGSAKARSASNQVAEMRLPRAAFDLDDTLLIHVGWVFEGFGFESSFASTPAEAWTEGAFDPDTVAWFEFDLGSPTGPDGITASFAD